MFSKRSVYWIVGSIVALTALTSIAAHTFARLSFVQSTEAKRPTAMQSRYLPADCSSLWFLSNRFSLRRIC